MTMLFAAEASASSTSSDSCSLVFCPCTLKNVQSVGCGWNAVNWMQGWREMAGSRWTGLTGAWLGGLLCGARFCGHKCCLRVVEREGERDRERGRERQREREIRRESWKEMWYSRDFGGFSGSATVKVWGVHNLTAVSKRWAVIPHSC